MAMTGSLSSKSAFAYYESRLSPSGFRKNARTFAVSRPRQADSRAGAFPQHNHIFQETSWKMRDAILRVVRRGFVLIIRRVIKPNDRSPMPPSMKKDLIALLPRLRRFACTMTKSPADADDLVQDACIRALMRQDQWNPAFPLDRWVFRILRNLWIDEVRKRQVRIGQGQVPADEATELVSSETGETRFAELELQKKISALPQELALVILVVSVEGYSYKEAAELLDVPVGTVMSRLHRARKQLAQDIVESVGVQS